MIFEGSEKKVEIVVDGVNLRSLGDDFWAEVVKKANATVLSKVSNDFIDAYLLSESSLFVWKDRFTMITCGTTTLVRAIEFVTEKLSKESIKLVVFQRKNEHFSHLQNSTFYDDEARIKERIAGLSLRFGPKHEHHNFLFHSEQPFTPDPSDFTAELLMYDLQGEAKSFLIQENQKIEDIRKFFNLESLLEGFIIDDFSFDPYGYSMNAIFEDKFCTIHITPQESSSYMSFETNLEVNEKTQHIFLEILNKVRPRSFDAVTFNCEMQSFMPKVYNKKTVVKERLNIGYDVTFCHYFLESDEVERASIL